LIPLSSPIDLAMIDASYFTAEQFLELLQDGERWIELSAGQLIRHTPPDEAHGNVVRNVSRALAVHLRKKPVAVACFDLGLVIGHDPDTVLCPAISCFPLPGGFEESDKLITETVPKLVMEVASTNDRRAELSERVRSHLDWGVEAVWVFDPVDRQAHQFQRGASSRRYRDHETLIDAIVLPGFQIPVADAFADPRWHQPDVNPS
jgi:Uma2 family endonuclease